jgi:hypothetical protein
MNRSDLQVVLLDLVGTARMPDLSRLTGDEWRVLDGMAAQHRLQPLLHVQHRDNPAIDPVVAKAWAQVYRAQALIALQQQADIDRTIALLQAAGFAPVALKGAWLARHAYPHPALRPLRDCDLLLDPDVVIAAFSLLLEQGYRLGEPPELPLADLVRHDKHLPPVQAPGGTWIELHHRLWLPEGAMDHASPAQFDADVRAHAVIEGDGIAYPAPIDMAVHLIVHAVYGHRLDCGPLLLADLDYLLAARPIDWDTFWLRARTEGWLAGARLALGLVERYRPGAAVSFTAAAGGPIDQALLDRMEPLLVQDLTTRQSAAVLASLGRGGWSKLSDRMLGRRRLPSGPATYQNKAAAGGFLGWAWSRLKRTGSDLAQRSVQDQARRLAELSAWLDRDRA